MSISELIRRMAAAGATAESIAIAVEAIEARDANIEARRAADRERKKRKRDEMSAEVPRNVRGMSEEVPRNVRGMSEEVPRNVRGMSEEVPRNVRGMSADTSPLKERSPPIPPSKENNPSLIVSSLRSETISRNRAFAQSVQQKFERFYAVYPKHTNRKTATLRFCAAVKSGVDPEHIVVAAERFAKAHQLAGTDKQYIPAPDVWLNKGRYDDEDLPQPRAGPLPSGRASISAVRNELIAELNGEIYGQNQSQSPDYSTENVIELVAFSDPPGERTG